MPLSFATRCGGMSSSKKACTMAAVIESWPHPAQSVDIDALVVAPREPERVASASAGCRTAAWRWTVMTTVSVSRWRLLHAAHHVVRAERQPAVVAHRSEPVAGDAGLQRSAGAELRVAVLLHHEAASSCASRNSSHRRARRGSRARAGSRAARPSARSLSTASQHRAVAAPRSTRCRGPRRRCRGPRAPAPRRPPLSILRASRSITSHVRVRAPRCSRRTGRGPEPRVK